MADSLKKMDLITEFELWLMEYHEETLNLSKHNAKYLKDTQDSPTLPLHTNEESSSHSTKFTYSSLHVDKITMRVRKRLVILLTDIVKLEMTWSLPSVSLSSGKVKQIYELINENQYVLRYSVHPKTPLGIFIFNCFTFGDPALACVSCWVPVKVS